MHQQLKEQAAQAAVTFVQSGTLLGVGTGSTVNCFIAALGEHLRAQKLQLKGAVSSSEASSTLLRAIGIPVLEFSAVNEPIPLYVDGADEINLNGEMIKGGGGALTREKLVAAMADTFICIADISKEVPVLGQFPLPVEILPSAAPFLTQKFARMGGTASLRLRSTTTTHAAQGTPTPASAFISDNGLCILDVHGLKITDAWGLEQEIASWPGVLTVGIFAREKASRAILASPQGILQREYR